ncbi:MAG: prepilin-type N-terminal cleavage/methylation domain-containing protein [Opitutaceae bacterium]|jgi:prepilin-type N-terminal cleavage/methylation domain-containing protein
MRSRIHSPVRSRRGGFTLAEIIVVVVVMGLLAGLLAGGVGNLLPVGRQEAAIGKARILNAARCSYSLLMPGAEAQWTSAASDADRVALLMEARVLDGSSAEFLASPGGYVLSVSGGLREATILTKDGAQVNYTTP